LRRSISATAWKTLASTLSFTDFIPLACQRLADFGGSVFLLGGENGVAEAAAKSLGKSFPGLQIAGTHSGFIRKGQDKEVIEQINRSGAQMLLIAMGVPSQELWLNRKRPFLNPSLVIGVGGLFDFLSGRIPRAPTALRAIGMEWFFRLCQEQRRMWRRYLLGDPLFLGRSLKAVARTHVAATRHALGLTAKRILDVCGASAVCVRAPVAASCYRYSTDNIGPHFVSPMASREVLPALYYL
jgi:exopolysaccharide biosynthesis WecB/TagA/CpsF family protein